MARKKRLLQIIQESAFLNLPPEIREQIYCMSLVRHYPIDLWPMKYTQDEETGRVFRLQEDLKFVRKEMATGLLTTCKQTFHEAGSIFWSKNTFRFSGDIYWFGARRFLGTIGPRALSQLQSLELFAPLVGLSSLDTALLDGRSWSERDRIFSNASEAKNRPKMHMAKARAAPWNRQSSHSGHYQVRRDGRKSKGMLATNVENVCYLLATAKTSLELKLVLPAGFGLTLPPKPHRSSSLWGVPDLWPKDLDLQLSEELLRVIPYFTRSVTLVLEAGAQLMSLVMVEQFTNKGIDVLCEPGSIFSYDPAQPAMKISDAKLWLNHHVKLDYLIGFPSLFEVEHGTAVPALGGRATSTPGPRKLSRVLKGFGGCRFIDQDAWRCIGCRWRGRQWGRAATRGYYTHNPANTRCTVDKKLVVKKRSMRARNI